jgi:hypothetical protein
LTLRKGIVAGGLASGVVVAGKRLVLSIVSKAWFFKPWRAVAEVLESAIADSGAELFWSVDMVDCLCCCVGRVDCN